MMPARIDDSSMSGAELELSDERTGCTRVLLGARIPLRPARGIARVLGNRVRCLGRGPMISGSARDKRINGIPMPKAFPGRLTGVERTRFEESEESESREKL